MPARLGRRFGLPTIPLFMIAGVIFGPNTPGVALVDDPHELELLAALGLVLLLFHLGLEFSLGDLVAGGRRLLTVGAIYLSLNVGGGFAFGAALGWGGAEALAIAGAVGISSSAILTKLLVELRPLALTRAPEVDRHLPAAPEQQVFSRQQRDIISGALEAAERSLRDVLVPRRDVVALPAAMPAAEARARLRAAAHSRAPVYESDLDDAGAVVHLRDLVDFDGTVAERARPAPVLPESVGVLKALRVMQGERHSLALIISEYGVFEGIVSVEDLVEELVGEIFDETDRDLQAAQRLPDGSWLLVGSFPIHDSVDLGVDLPEGDDYATIAGLVLDRLGHLPRTGESLAIDGWRISVLSIEGHAIARVRVSPVANDRRVRP